MRQPVINLREQRDRGQHPGLILARYLAEQNDDGRDKRALLGAACTAGRDPSLIALYRRSFERWRQGLSGVKAEADLRTPAYARLIVGLGSKGVIEAGLRLHHTYGVPLIPGSALKGLASHYCHEVYGAADKRFSHDNTYHDLLFGKTDDSGVIRFEDAWIHPDSLGARDQGLLADVMTPHHQKWQTDETVAPTDFDSPIPVPFLSVAGSFRIAVCWQGPKDTQAEAWTKCALAILEEALKEWGVGGKTSSGYGRLIQAAQSPAPDTGTTAEPLQAVAKPPSLHQKVQVKVLAPHPAGGKNCFRVQESGKVAGILQAGKPPEKLPVADDLIEVYRDNTDLRSPRYRWDTPTPPQQPTFRKNPRR